MEISLSDSYLIKITLLYSRHYPEIDPLHIIRRDLVSEWRWVDVSTPYFILLKNVPGRVCGSVYVFFIYKKYSTIKKRNRIDDSNEIVLAYSKPTLPYSYE